MRHSSIGAPSVREGFSFKETFEGTWTSLVNLLGGGKGFETNPKYAKKQSSSGSLFNIQYDSPFGFLKIVSPFVFFES